MSFEFVSSILQLKAQNEIILTIGGSGKTLGKICPLILTAPVLLK